MSSRELLALLNGLPDESKFKEATQRTFRVIERKGKLMLTPALGTPPRDVEVIGEYVDWPFGQKLLARNTAEIASMRADGHDYEPDMTGLREPLQKILADHENSREAKRIARARAHIDAGLLGS